jgi:hypothetical protein
MYNKIRMVIRNKSRKWENLEGKKNLGGCEEEEASHF